MFALRTLLLWYLWFVASAELLAQLRTHDGPEVSQAVFESLEELARIVDISYCIGTTGIQKPFKCLSRCSDFEGFELVTVRTGAFSDDLI